VLPVQNAPSPAGQVPHVCYAIHSQTPIQKHMVCTTLFVEKSASMLQTGSPCTSGAVCTNVFCTIQVCVCSYICRADAHELCSSLHAGHQSCLKCLQTVQLRPRRMSGHWGVHYMQLLLVRPDPCPLTLSSPTDSTSSHRSKSM